MKDKSTKVATASPESPTTQFKVRKVGGNRPYVAITSSLPELLSFMEKNGFGAYNIHFSYKNEWQFWQLNYADTAAGTKRDKEEEKE